MIDERYDYFENTLDDAEQFIAENIDLYELCENCHYEKEAVIERLLEILSEKDEVCGNGYYGYYNDEEKAAAALRGNEHLAATAFHHYRKCVRPTPENLDTLCRVYVLSHGVIQTIVDKIKGLKEINTNMSVPYSYYEALYHDALRYIDDNYDVDELGEQNKWDAETLEQIFTDDMWAVDEVTGNGPDGYWDNITQAEDALAHNWNLIKMAANEFGGIDKHNCDPKSIDAMCRIYLLPDVITEIVQDIIDKHNSGEDNNG